MAQSYWRGCKDIQLKYNGEYSDPELIYHGHVFNYWEIEDMLWESFLDETGYKDSDADNQAIDQRFDIFVQEYAPVFLDQYLHTDSSGKEE